VALLPPRFCQAIAPFAGGIPNNPYIWPAQGDIVFRIMFLVGSYDTDLIHNAVQLGYQSYLSAGYPVELNVIPYWGHQWYAAGNDQILDFFLDEEYITSNHN